MRTAGSAAGPSAIDRSVRRVLMTADAVGGVWQYALDLSSALARRGIDVTLAVLGPPLDEAQQAEACRRRLRVLQSACRLEWMDDPWADVERAGRWLIELERALEPDIVHLNGYAHAALDWRAPAIVVAHSCVRSWWRAVRGGAAPAAWDRYSEAVARGLRAARLVIAPTQAMRAALHEEYGAIGDVAVIPNGGGRIGRPTAVPRKSELVLTAGRLWDDAKNVAALCGVAADLSWPVYIAGDRGAAAPAAPPTRNVHHLGRLPSPVLNEWYGRAAIYALPARYEPFGLSVLEAASAGCALVLGDIPSLRENWAEAAVFVSPEDCGALRRAIQQLIEDATRRERLGGLAHARAARFTVERMAGSYLDVYDTLLAHAAVA
jgi:glycogen synthase